MSAAMSPGRDETKRVQGSLVAALLTIGLIAVSGELLGAASRQAAAAPAAAVIAQG